MMLGMRGFPDLQGVIETHAEHLAPLLVNLGCDLEVVVRTHSQKPSTGKIWCGIKFTKIWSPKSKACGEYCVDKTGRMMHVDDDICDLIWSDAREKVI